MYVAYGEIGNHDAVLVIFQGGGRKTCLIIYKSSVGKQVMLLPLKVQLFKWYHLLWTDIYLNENEMDENMVERT